MGLEILWRARTHVSMGIAGGLCGMLLWWLYSIIDAPVWLAYIIGLILISLVELAAGIVLNLKLKLAVWDYSKMPSTYSARSALPFPCCGASWALRYGILKRLIVREALIDQALPKLNAHAPYGKNLPLSPQKADMRQRALLSRQALFLLSLPPCGSAGRPLAL